MVNPQLEAGQRWVGHKFDQTVLRICQEHADSVHVTNTNQSCVGWCVEAAIFEVVLCEVNAKLVKKETKNA